MLIRMILVLTATLALTGLAENISFGMTANESKSSVVDGKYSTSSAFSRDVSGDDTEAEFQSFIPHPSVGALSDEDRKRLETFYPERPSVILISEELTKQAIANIPNQATAGLSPAKQVRHNLSSKEEVEKAKQNYLKEVSTWNPSRHRISEAYLMLSKIASRENNQTQSFDYLAMSLSVGSPNHLKTLRYAAEKYLSLSVRESNSQYLLKSIGYLQRIIKIIADPKGVSKEEGGIAPKILAEALLALGNAGVKNHFYCYRKAYQLAKKYRLPKQEVDTLLALSKLDRSNGVRWSRMAWKKSLQLRDEFRQAKARLAQGNTAEKDDDKVKFFDDALTIATKINGVGIQIQALIGLGNYSHPNSKHFFVEAMKLLKTHHSTKFFIGALIGYATSLPKSVDQVDRALRAVKLADKLGEPRLKIRARITSGNLKSKLKDKHLEEAVELATILGANDLLCSALRAQGDLLASQGMNDEAKAIYEKALKLETRKNRIKLLKEKIVSVSSQAKE